MFTKLFCILLLQISFSVWIAHGIGGTSMDSTHYDRRRLQQQCLMNSQIENQHQTTHWITMRSFSSLSSNENSSITFRRQITINNDEDRLIARVSSNAIDVNNADPLGIDQALLIITVDQQIIGNLTVYVQTIECIECPYEEFAQDLSSNKPVNLTINTKYNYRIRIESNSQASCLETLILYEHGQYGLNVSPANSGSNLRCILIVQRSANNVYLPLIIGSVILLVLFIACIIGQKLKVREHLISLKNRYFKREILQETTHSYDLQARSPIVTNDVTDTNATVTNLPSIHKVSNVLVPRSKRVLSLDAFRGFTLIAMIFVNYGGGSYVQFEHAPWHGLTFADIVFPFFVWMLGTSLVISLKNSIDKGVPKRTLLKKIAIRTIKLFLIGFILGTRFKVDLKVVRIPGVLQRFAIVYGVIATIEVLCTRPNQYLLATNIQISTETTVRAGTIQRMRRLFGDIINFPGQWMVIVSLTTIWILVIYLLPFENCPAGYLGPGGIHDNGRYEYCTGGITGYIDRMIFTSKHLYQYPTCQTIYGCRPPFDPENLFGAIPTIFLAFLGVQAGRILVMYQRDRDRLIRLFIWSIVTLAIGLGLSGGTLSGGPMPLNKNLWTLSFSFFTGGLAFAGFSLMYILIDMLKWWNATPFQYPGTNSILIYITHSIFATFFPVQWVVENTHAAHLAMGLWGCIFWIIIAYIFYKKRIFLVL